MELENAFLREGHNSTSCSKKPYQLRKYTTAGTSGHMMHSGNDIPLLKTIKIIHPNDLDETNATFIGSGQYGTCHLKSFCHFQVCVKLVNPMKRSSFEGEANITSKFVHPNFPYLFGVCINPYKALVLSYHAIGNHAVSLHSALFPKSQVQKDILLTAEIAWIDIIKGILCGLEHLHSKQHVLHSDLKSDNVVLGLSTSNKIQPVIIDFGKACKISEGNYYTLSVTEKEIYKLYHSHIAPDLRDGASKQSVFSDIYAFGKITSTVNERKLKNALFEELSSKCLQYNRNERPNIEAIKLQLKRNTM